MRLIDPRKLYSILRPGLINRLIVNNPSPMAVNILRTKQVSHYTWEIEMTTVSRSQVATARDRLAVGRQVFRSHLHTTQFRDQEAIELLQTDAHTSKTLFHKSNNNANQFFNFHATAKYRIFMYIVFLVNRDYIISQ